MKDTKARIKSQLNVDDARAEEIWEECKSDEPDWNSQIIFTTFARTQAWGKIESKAHFEVQSKNEYGTSVISIREKKVPDDTVIFFDDPSALMFNPLKPYDEKYQHLVRPSTEEEAKILMESEEGVPIIPFRMLEVVERNGRKYFVKPEELKFGYGLRKCRLVFTTTELVTAWMIEQQYPKIYIPTLMPEGQMKAGEIVMIRSELVRSKIDGLLMPIFHRLKKSHQVEFIGDAIGAEYNMVNSKGMNKFTETDTLIKCSLPSVYEMRPILDGLGLEGNKQNETDLLAWIALDKLQQAIGRNCGYRATDKAEGHVPRKAVVLCDPKLFTKFTNHKNPMMRYWVDDANIIKEPKRFVGIEEQPEGLVKEVCWFAAYNLKYLKSGIGMRRTAFEDDYKEMALSISTSRRPAYKRRLLVALNTVIKDTKVSDPKLSEKLYGLFVEWGGDVILKTDPKENQEKPELSQNETTYANQ